MFCLSRSRSLSFSRSSCAPLSALILLWIEHSLFHAVAAICCLNTPNSLQVFVDSFYSPELNSHLDTFHFALCVLCTLLFYMLLWTCSCFLVCYVVFMLSSGWALRLLGIMQVSTYRIADVLSLSLSLSLSSLILLPLLSRLLSSYG